MKIHQVAITHEICCYAAELNPAVVKKNSAATRCRAATAAKDAKDWSLPSFGSQLNPISTRGGRLCPPNCYWRPRIFRPSNVPELIYSLTFELTFYPLKLENCAFW